MTTVPASAAPERRPRSPRRLPPHVWSAPPPAGLSLLLVLALLVLLSPINNNSGNGNSAPSIFVAAHVPSTALFEALDADADGAISRQDWDASLTAITSALGIDNSDISNHVAGGELGAMGRNEAAAQRSVHRDGLTGDNLVPRKAFNPGNSNLNTGSGGTGGNAGGSGGTKRKLSFTKAFTASVAMILATEIGDKTFFIAAVMSMRNDRMAVFAGAILALVVMTILSTMMGLVLPSILPRKYTHIIGGILFLYFGVKLVLDSRSMQDDKVSDELEEVEEELLHTSTKNKKDEDEESSSDMDGGSDVDMENGSSGGDGGAQESGRRRRKAAKRSAGSGLAGATAYQSTSFQATFVQSLTLTFLAEWGDRSQIATIALAAAKDPLGVTVGGCLGHSMCTGLAVVGGRMLAARISEKTVSFYGGIIFTIFGVHSLFFES